MAIWARIDSGVAAELTETDPAGRFHPSLVWVTAPTGVLVGDLYANGAFSRPPAPAAIVPQSVSKVQAIFALLALPGSESGKTLLDDVNAAVAAAADPRVALAWNNAASIDRTGTFVTTVAKAAPLSMTDARLDALFVAAAQIVV